jgi:transposase-like protein
MRQAKKQAFLSLLSNNPRISIKDFCESNGITDSSLKKWMKQYDEGGLEGLARADAEIKEVLPEGIDRTEESYKREILKLRIENERLKKSYAVQTNADGEREYVRLKPRSSK